MSTKTTNYNLIKPAGTDPAEITATNQNWDTIDAELKKSSNHSGDTNNPHGVTATQVGALPIAGGTLTGKEFRLNNGYSSLYSSENWLEIFNCLAKNDESNRSGVRFSSADVLSGMIKCYRQENGVKTFYELFGLHNKPTGTYTGNGLAGYRQIETGGLGDLCLITSSNGHAVLLCNRGGFCIKMNTATGGNVTVLNWLDASFITGTLKIESSNEAINQSGVVYTYTVL